MEGSTSYRLNAINDRIAAEVVKSAAEIGCSPAQLALKWIWDKGIIPIIGARKLDQLTDNLGCLDVQIPDEITNRLEEVSQIELGFPHDFVTRPGAKKMIYGDMVDKIHGIQNPNLK
jgi:diketogulonate reductase-like aldo/keto reductase